jgi:catechol 2,3-dioxygenase
LYSEVVKQLLIKGDVFMLPEIAKLGHIALITPDLKKSLWFFTEVLGLEETEEVNGTHYLRAWGDFEHHSLSLTKGEKSKVDHIAWRTKRPEDVEKFAEMLDAAGAKVTK